MGLTFKGSISLAGKLSGVTALGAREANIAKTYAVSLVDGALAGQADRLWTAAIPTLAASGFNDHDLVGSLADPLLGVASFARVKALVVSAYAANTNDVVIGAAASNAWAALLGATGTVRLRPGATLAVFAGAADLTAYATVSGTGDLLRITNGGAGTAVGYDIAVVGASA